jgi:hypothetical protein
MKNLSTGVMQFAVGNMPLFEMFQDYWNHYRATEQKKNVEYDRTLSFDEKEAKLNAALKKEIIRRSGVSYATDKNIGEWFYHPLVIHETFAIIGALVDMILADTIIDSIGLYTDVRQGGFGDSFSFEIEPSDLFVVSKAGKAQKNTEVKKQYKGLVTVIPEFRAVTVGVSLYRVLSGVDSLAKFVSKAVRSMESRMVLDCYNAFATACDAITSTTTTGLQVSGYTQAYLVRIAQQVSAWNQQKAVVVGTQLALVNVLPDDSNYRYTLDDEFMTLGYVRTAFGFDCLMLPQVADPATQFGTLISNSRLWILSPSSQKILKLCLEGNTISTTNQPFDNANLTQNTTLTKSWGVAMATNAVAGVITL